MIICGATCDIYRNIWVTIPVHRDLPLVKQKRKKDHEVEETDVEEVQEEQKAYETYEDEEEQEVEEAHEDEENQTVEEIYWISIMEEIYWISILVHGDLPLVKQEKQRRITSRS